MLKEYQITNKKNIFRELYKNYPILKEYNGIIEKLLDCFYLADARIEVCDKNASSEYRAYGGATKDKFRELIIGINNRTNPRNIIWSIFHEFGHLNQNDPTNEEKTKGTIEKYLRECDAWEIGKNKFYEFEELKEFENEFLAYARKGAESYNPIKM